MAHGAVVVGTGFGCLTHARALRAAGFDVVALVGRDADRTAARARDAGIPNALTSLEPALDVPGVVAVTVATPPHTHAPLVLQAVAAGKHVVCEKPFTRDAAEARHLLAAAERAGVVHLVGTEFRWATGQALMARAVATGLIGEPRLATFLLHIPLLADPAAEVPDWWSDGGQGGGWLGAHAAHVIDQVRTTLGEFEGVSAALPTVGRHSRAWSVEDSYSVRFRLVSGVEGVLQSSSADWGPILITARVVGTEGTVWAEGDNVSVADHRGTRVLGAPADLPAEPAQPPPADALVTAYDLLHSTGIDVVPYTRLYRTFAALIDGGPVAADPAPGTFADGVAAMEVMDAIRRSAAEGLWAPI
ncbi:MAG TPA: Gfo/Idh/MocA family oxidoreductase [Acidimicrobiales bacterium]